MNTLKNVAIVAVFVVLLGAMIVGSALDIGRLDPFAGSPEESREYCYNTPPSLMNGDELRHCDWLRREDERPFVPTDFSEDFSGDTVGSSTDDDDP